MGYQAILRQARDLLEGEIAELRAQLEQKEANLRRLDSFLRDPARPKSGEPSLTQQVVAVLYNLTQETEGGVPARAVVEAFIQKRRDVNESTIRSTLYQVTRKLSPTKIRIGDSTKHVRVSKKGPLYNVEEISSEEEAVMP